MGRLVTVIAIGVMNNTTNGFDNPPVKNINNAS